MSRTINPPGLTRPAQRSNPIEPSRFNSPSDPALASRSPAPATGPGPLSPEHIQALADGRLRAKKLRRAASVATMSGWTMAFFAFCTLVCVLFGDFVSLVMGVGLGVVAYNELRGGAMLRRFDLRGPKLLGYNQFGLGV